MASLADIPTEEFIPRTIDPDDERAFMDAIEKMGRKRCKTCCHGA